MADHHRKAPLASAWSDFPQEILCKIKRRLDSTIDEFQFRSVCKNWHSTRKPNSVSILSPILPCKIVSNNLPFIDRPHDHVILVARAVFLVEPPWLSWSSDCWLLTVEEMVPGKLRILYPLSTDHVKHLPSNCPNYLDLTKFRVSEVAKSYGFRYASDGKDVPGVQRVVMCSDSTVMVLYGGGTLVGVRLKSGNWCYVRDSLISSFKDVISCGVNGVRAVDCYGNVHLIDHRVTSVVKTVSARLVFRGASHISLFNFEGELFLAACFKRTSSVEFRFAIYRLDKEQCTWITADGRYDCLKVHFVSSSWCFCVSTSDLNLCLSIPEPENSRKPYYEDDMTIPSDYMGYKDYRMVGDYVVFSVGSFGPSGLYYNLKRLFGGASLDLKLGVFFFDETAQGFWNKSLCISTANVLWPPPIWFWPDTWSSSRDDDEENEESNINSQNASSFSKDEQSPQFVAGVPANKQAFGTKVLHVGNSDVLTIQNLNQFGPTVLFEGVHIKSNLVPTLQKILDKYGDIMQGTRIRSSDMIARALESLATAVIILQSSSGRSLNKTHADYLCSVLCDLQLMHFKVDWLAPFVEKAKAVYTSKPLIDSLKDFDRAKSQAEEMKLKVLDELAKLDEVEENMMLVYERLPVLQSMDFDQSLGDGLC